MITSKVRLLPELLINKIAAGEVVERPASVVKELVENAIDSGATQIQVTLKNGGKDLISVLDNGCGMNETDARFAVERHATSKIYEEDDLFRIDTLGFRGEALASIASVSHFELLSCEDASESGTRLTIKGGILEHQGRAGFPQGTKITVERLFFNTPARLKFLKSTATELQHIQQLLTQLALANPTLQFRLTHDQKLLLNVGSGQTLESRIQQLFGYEFASGLLEVTHQENYLQYSGLVSFPSQTQSSKRWQYLFVNGRHVKCPPVTHAIYDGYRGFLSKSQHPAFFLNLRVAPSEIDVNVHPAKTEIRFRNARVIHAILADHLARALKEGAAQRFFGSRIGEQSLPEPSGQFEMPLLDAEAPTAPSQRRASKRSSTPRSARPEPPRRPPPPEAPVQSGEFPAEEKPVSHAPPPPEVPEPTPVAAPHTSGWQVLGRHPQGWVLVDHPEGLLLLDFQQTEQRLKARVLAQEEPPEVQNFEVPLLLDLPPQEGLLLEQHLPTFQRLGIQLEPFGKNSFSIQTLPQMLAEAQAEPVLKEVLQRLSLFGKRARPSEIRQDAIEVIAHYAAQQVRPPESPDGWPPWLEQVQQLPDLLAPEKGQRAGFLLTHDELQKRLGRGAT